MSSYSIILKEDAENDLDEIYHYYESQKEGLGKRFLAVLDNSLAKVKTQPFHTFNVGNSFRRVVTRTFPYSIYYLIIEDKIVVFAILHQSLKPGIAYNRIK